LILIPSIPTIHTQAYNHSIKTNKGKATGISRPYDDFHIYAIDWSRKKIDFFIDDGKVFTFKNEGKGKAEWPFDEPFYLILNLAIGGAWRAAGSGSFHPPAKVFGRLCKGL
jgi:beta-glucanase (GH16 family)